MFKILILAYLMGQDPVDTQKTFILDNNFENNGRVQTRVTFENSRR